MIQRSAGAGEDTVQSIVLAAFLCVRTAAELISVQHGSSRVKKRAYGDAKTEWKEKSVRYLRHITRMYSKAR